MFSMQILDVVIGLTFVYVLLSTLCAAATELIEQMVKHRRKLLADGVGRMLGGKPGSDPEVLAFYNHPLIASLSGRATRMTHPRPSYIPAGMFATAILDTVVNAPGQGGQNAERVPLSDSEAIGSSLSDRQEKNPTARALLALYEQADGNLVEARKNIEDWFNDSMDRVAGQYRRYASIIAGIVGIVFVFATNADTLQMAKSLWTDDELRESIVAMAVNTVENEPAKGEEAYKEAKERMDEIAEAGLPMGWKDGAGLLDLKGKARSDKILGLLITALAVSLGAPFWFDMLNKLVNLRAAGKVRVSEQGEGTTPKSP